MLLGFEFGGAVIHCFSLQPGKYVQSKGQTDSGVFPQYIGRGLIRALLPVGHALTVDPGHNTRRATGGRPLRD